MFRERRVRRVDAIPEISSGLRKMHNDCDFNLRMSNNEGYLIVQTLLLEELITKIGK